MISPPVTLREKIVRLPPMGTLVIIVRTEYKLPLDWCWIVQDYHSIMKCSPEICWIRKQYKRLLKNSPIHSPLPLSSLSRIKGCSQMKILQPSRNTGTTILFPKVPGLTTNKTKSNLRRKIRGQNMHQHFFSPKQLTEIFSATIPRQQKKQQQHESENSPHLPTT